MEDILKSILFDKYQVLRRLGQGSFGTVYLVRHLSLDQERAIKLIPREADNSDSTLFEARLLKSFNHPGIPRIFDIEEDKDFFYIVEEYINGLSLDQFLLHQPIISETMLLSFCEQLCDIFTYLHRIKPQPFIYKDLKPEHIIICGDRVKLIDFGNNFNNLGNLQFSAPELFLDIFTSPKPAADIYSIGMLLKYLKPYLSFEPSPQFISLINKACDRNPDLRFETVEELYSELVATFSQKNDSHLYQKIAVVGSFKGCGCTHIAISIVSCLNYQGNLAVYLDKNNSCNLLAACELDSAIHEKDGYMFYKLFQGIPCYGPGVIMDEPTNSTLVYDFGTDYSASSLMEMDLVILVTSASLWRRKEVLRVVDRIRGIGLNPLIVTNLSSTREAIGLARGLGSKVLCYPADSTPFQVNKKKLKLTEQLLSKEGESQLFLKRVKRKHNR